MTSQQSSPESFGLLCSGYLLVQKLKREAILPTKGSAMAAGYDLHAAEEVVVYADGRRVIGTGIAVTVPTGHYGRIAPRSGLAVRYGLDILGGVIDSDYTGEVKVLLQNHGKSEIRVLVGDRIAQLIIEKISFLEIKEVDNLEKTIRGQGGFGSTGK